MPMRLEARLNRLERVVGSCSTCHGEGKIVVTYHHDGEPPPDDPPGCPECGETFHIRVNYITHTVIER